MAITDRRLQVYFPEPQYRAIKARAHAQGKSIGMLVREALARYLLIGKAAERRDGYAALIEGAGACRDAGGDASRRHDEHLGGGRW